MGFSFLTIFILFRQISFLPSIDDTIILEKWLCVGPFSIGIREGIIGVDETIETDEKFEPNKEIIYPSILAQGGEVKWQEILSENGKVEIEYDNVLWDTIQDYFGAAGIMGAGYAYGDFYCNGTKRALIVAKGISSFRLNGRSYPGDRYRDGFLKTPVILNDGKNRVLLRIGGFGNHSFSFKIIPPPAPLMIIAEDITSPDLIEGGKAPLWTGIPLVNTTNRRLYNIFITVAGRNIKKAVSRIPDIMPLSALKIPVAIEPATAIETQDDSLKITISVTCGDFVIKKDVWVEVKQKDEAQIRTFISNIDGSCQYYAVLPPKNYEEDSTYALIMTCHGAGVKAERQINAYIQKDWAFVIAPTNRRRYGFDWQDWGRLDFLETLEDVKRQFNIDTNRIYLTGHSMGGHGAWHIGTSHPDIFAAMAPSAGWTSIYLYVPAFLQKSYTFAHPEQLKFRNMALREDNPLLFLENLWNVPTYILHGGADDNVPPIQGRMFAKYLYILNHDYTYNEIEGQGHWWDIDTTPGVDCVDSEDLMYFLKTKVRNPYPKKIVFKTSDIDHSNRAYWVRLDELEKLYRDGMIIAEITDTEGFVDESSGVRNIVIDVSNVNKFTIFLSEELIVPGSVNFVINGRMVKFEYREKCTISFRKKRTGSFFWCTEPSGDGKTQNLYGPIKRAYFNPFVFVYGTTGDSLATANNLHQARLQSYTWWYRANGFAEILADTEITEDIIKNYNLIVFGNPETNFILKWINHKLPIRIEERQIFVNKKRLEGQNLCLTEIYPNPLNPEKFILLNSATSEEAQKSMGLFVPLLAGSGLPDFIVYDKSALTYGWAGIIATGFFDERWKFSEKLSFIKD